MTKAKVVKVYPTQEEIKKIISYDPITGIITNIQTGNILKCEQIGIKNKAYSLSRIILIYYYNYDSTRKIYAKNGILSDLRIDNILFEKEKFSRANVTKEYLNEYFYYDNGELFILKTTVNSGKIGRKIGHLASDGYIYTKIRSISFKLHQLIYIYHNGAIPKGCEIDHGNGVKHDNRIDNLRIGTHAENVQNLRVAPKIINLK